ncbi:response regulator [Dyadobacter sandarakinus]|uniref:Response regulator n=1 Tax=Dyadobacter sandarakinus TaxID=2747268 RepID=A0ABX7I4A0_9BACT|nr:response regulator [Dyadobacter sandarakinus]QRR00659.1 response regulator [Dyadobacter sandarakinus]
MIDQPCVVYLVDDEADYRFLVQQVFSIFLPGQQIRFFGSGLDLVAHLELASDQKKGTPEVLILDIDMPRMNGFQTLLQVKRHPDWQGVPVVMMTNRDQAEYAQESYRLGASAFLLKPINLNAIRDVMGFLCEHKGDFEQLPGLIRRGA